MSWLLGRAGGVPKLRGRDHSKMAKSILLKGNPMRISERASEAFRKVPPKWEGEAAPRSLRITGFRANLEILALDLRFSFRTLEASTGPPRI